MLNLPHLEQSVDTIILPGSNTGVYIPEFKRRDPFVGLSVSEFARLSKQKEDFGHFAALLSWGIDTVHYHLSVDAPALRDMVNRCAAWADDVSRLDVWAGGVNGYSYTINRPDGLRIYVSSGANLDMGLWLVGGAGWCLARDFRDIEFDIKSAVRDAFDVDIKHLRLRLRRVDPRFDFAGDGLQPWANLENIVCQARKHRELFAEWAEDNTPSASVYGSTSKFTGGTFGKADVRARFYNKSVEMKHDVTARWLHHWGYAPDLDGVDVWRVEYQLRGKWLKEFLLADGGSENMQTLHGRLGDMIYKLLDWMRFCETQDRKDIERPLLGWWAAIVDSIYALDLECRGVVREVLKRRPNLEQLRAQMLGLAVSWAAARAFLADEGGKRLDPGGLLADLWAEIDGATEELRIKYDAKLAQYQSVANL